MTSLWGALMSLWAPFGCDLLSSPRGHPVLCADVWGVTTGSPGMRTPLELCTVPRSGLAGGHSLVLAETLSGARVQRPDQTYHRHGRAAAPCLCPRPQPDAFPRALNKVPGWHWGLPACRLGNWEDCSEATEKWEEKRQLAGLGLV